MDEVADLVFLAVEVDAASVSDEVVNVVIHVEVMARGAISLLVSWLGPKLLVMLLVKCIHLVIGVAIVVRVCQWPALPIK
jgi:hypothetical protein